MPGRNHPIPTLVRRRCWCSCQCWCCKEERLIDQVKTLIDHGTGQVLMISQRLLLLTIIAELL